MYLDQGWPRCSPPPFWPFTGWSATLPAQGKDGFHPAWPSPSLHTHQEGISASWDSPTMWSSCQPTQRALTAMDIERGQVGPWPSPCGGGGARASVSWGPKPSVGFIVPSIFTNKRAVWRSSCQELENSHRRASKPSVGPFCVQGPGD